MGLLQGDVSSTGPASATLQRFGRRAIVGLGVRWSAYPAWAWPVAITLAGALLRLIPWLAAYPFHRDEALYGAWARAIASGADPFLLNAWVDKPPLVLYLLAGSLRLFGASQASLRLPAMLASMITLPLVYMLARRIGGQSTAGLAALLVAISPFGILFAPTAFTDPWLVLWFVAGAWAALARRPFWAGLCLGLAVASKQSGASGAPLILALLFVPPPGTIKAETVTQHSKRSWIAVLRSLFLLLLGFALAGGPVYWWDTLRWATRPSFWQRSLDTYGGLYLAPVTTWGQRAQEWAQQAGYLFGSPLLTLPVLGLVALAVHSAWRRRDLRDLSLAGYSIGYLAFHFFVTIQPWDRYLLPLLPWLAILAARGYAVAWHHMRRRGQVPGWKTILATAALATVVAGAAWLGQSGRVPVGSDHGAFTGLELVAGRLHALPPNAIIYHRSLGWYLDFYLYGQPTERIWCEDAQTLANDAATAAGDDATRPQWLVLAMAADEHMSPEVGPALAKHGLQLANRQVFRRPDGSESFEIYQIVPQGSSR